jgi:methyl-accepting chemotaxis protein
MKLTVAGRIYGVVALSFAGLIALSVLQVVNQSASLREQRQSELKHLAEVALAIARQEHGTIAAGTAPEEARRRAAQRIGALRYGTGDYFWINDLEPRMVMHPLKPELDGQNLAQMKDPAGKHLFVEFADTVRKAGAGFVDYQWPKPGKEAPQPKLSYVTGFEPFGWVIGTGVYIDDLDAQVWRSVRTVALAAGLLLMFVGACALLVARRMSAALAAMTHALSRLGEGDFSVRLPGLGRTDELGDMSRSIEQFKLRAQEKAAEEARLEIERRQLAEEAKRKALQQMADTVEAETTIAVEQIAVGTDRMAASAGEMSAGARSLGENSNSVAAAAEEALATAQTVAAAAAQLSGAIAEISGQVSGSRQLTEKAVAASRQAQSTIGRLSEAASRVGTVTSLINEIASQTNLLALNATIEAARAGDAGRGFAVVASEVKSLAQQTASATSEIAQQIADMQHSTRESVSAIEAISEVIRSVEQVSSAIAASIEEQTTVTHEIARNVEETSQAAQDVAQRIVAVSNEAVATGERASSIQGGSADIAAKIAQLRSVLIKVIRTTTTDVDRREAERYLIDRAGEIRAGGQVVKVRLIDVSAGGAATLTGRPLPVDTGLTLRVEGVPGEVAGRVLRAGDDRATIVFDEPAGAWVDSLLRARAA